MKKSKRERGIPPKEHSLYWTEKGPLTEFGYAEAWFLDGEE